MLNNSRRSFLKKTGYLSFGFLHLALNSHSVLAKSFSKISNRKLKKDTKKILDIHPSLNYKIISTYGDKMDDVETDFYLKNAKAIVEYNHYRHSNYTL